MKPILLEAKSEDDLNAISGILILLIADILDNNFQVYIHINESVDSSDWEKEFSALMSKVCDTEEEKRRIKKVGCLPEEDYYSLPLNVLVFPGRLSFYVENSIILHESSEYVKEATEELTTTIFMEIFTQGFLPSYGLLFTGENTGMRMKNISKILLDSMQAE